MGDLALAGEFAKFSVFERLCLSDDGYNPRSAMNPVSLYAADDPKAAELKDTAREQMKLWFGSSLATPAFPESRERKEDRQFESPPLQQRGTANR